jgi:hypothetical protein
VEPDAIDGRRGARRHFKAHLAGVAIAHGAVELLFDLATRLTDSHLISIYAAPKPRQMLIEPESRCSLRSHRQLVLHAPTLLMLRRGRILAHRAD